MDVVSRLSSSGEVISTVEMHTVGEPTRIVYNGFPPLQGTLLEQRAQAATPPYDRIRRRLMLEPRGHRDMYGAILRPDTEHTKTGAAHMGVLFTTNEGYSTMCGHATIALSRFLIDTHDLTVFPQRNQVQHDPATRTAKLLLHAPCGVVDVTVPTNTDGTQSDPSRPVSHLSVPSFTTGIDTRVPIPAHLQWKELQGRTSVNADFSYGGAFYCLVSASELGFSAGLSGHVPLRAMDDASRCLKRAVNEDPALRHLFAHPDHDDLGFLYSVIIIDDKLGSKLPGSDRAETGLCFFADQQIDRSPTGSGVAARVALAYAKDRSRMAGSNTSYHSLLSLSLKGTVGFTGSVHEEVGSKDGFPIIRVRVEGHASYVGAATYFVDDCDPLGDDGFLFDENTS